MNHRILTTTLTPSLLISLALACSESPPDPATGTGGTGGSTAGRAGTVGGASGAGTTGVGGGAGTVASGGAGGAPATGGTAGAGAAGSGGAGGGTSGAGTAGGGAGGGTSGSAGASSGGLSGGGAGGLSGAGGAGAGRGGASGASGTGAGGAANERLAKFSFFVTSLGAMRTLAQDFGVGNEGFGGDLRYGEATGLAGADKICRTIAERAMPGAGAKEWHAFLSATTGGPNDGPVHAKDRVGQGPWYDALGRLVSMNLNDLIQDRPRGADPLIINDLPNEYGIPNHTDGAPGCSGNACPDNHQVLTGTYRDGTLHPAFSYQGQQYTQKDATCNDWTNRAESGQPWCGHSWPRAISGTHWIDSFNDGGCAPCVRTTEAGGITAKCVGSAGGYGGFYCLAINAP